MSDYLRRARVNDLSANAITALRWIPLSGQQQQLVHVILLTNSRHLCVV